MAKTEKGIMKCEGQTCRSHEHNAPVVVFENEKGTLSYSCHFCGRAPYARTGTGQHAEWIEAMQRNTPRAAGAQPARQESAPVEAAPAPAEKMAPEKKPAKAGAGTFFG